MKEFERNIRVAISPICNMNCIYCIGDNRSIYSRRMAAMEDIRNTPLSEGCISTEQLLDILSVFRRVGFNGISLTGGEPMINQDWDSIIDAAANMGFKRREITTNGLLLGKYCDEHGKLPKLTTIKVSFDTADKNNFDKITGGKNFDRVVESVHIARKYIDNIRANRVMLRDQMEDLEDYLDFCYNNGFTSANLMELYAYPDDNWDDEERKFFEKHFVSYKETCEALKKLGIIDENRHRYGHSMKLSNGFTILATDSKYTIRDLECKKCKVFCQQGKFTVRIATDGTITMCPNFNGNLYSIDGISSLINGTLEEKIKPMYESLAYNQEENVFNNFLKKYDIDLKKNFEL